MKKVDEFPDFYTGAPLDPNDLWFREKFIEELWEQLARQHCLLSAPRRTGKTSVMDHLVAFPQKAFSPVPVFVQDLDHPGEFILTLLDAFQNRHPKFFHQIYDGGSQLVGGVLNRIQSIGVGGFKVALREGDPHWGRNWKNHGDDFFDRVRKSAKRVLFVVDEFPDMILNMNQHHPALVQPFLSWFRGHRMNPQPTQDSVRWLLGGSINLSSTLDAMGCIDKINDLHEEHLPVLTTEQVKEFVTRMLTCRNVEIEEDFAGKLADRLGRPVPLFLQMVTQDLYRMWKRSPGRLCQADLDVAFNELIVNSAARDKLQHYYSRIVRYYKEPKGTAAHEVLAKLSVSADGMARDRLLRIFEGILLAQGESCTGHARKQLFNELMRDLENDFYVVETKPGYFDFANGLLKIWWRKYYA